MRIAYFGTPDFAVEPLKALHSAGHDIAIVVTQPDRRRNRGQMQPTAVKQAALELGLPVFAPEKIKAAESVALLQELHCDLFVVVAYGQLLSEQVLAIPPRGSINIHASLLPKYRGAAPIHWAVINGEKTTGVSIMYLDLGMDSGDVIATAEVEITPDISTGELYDQLCSLGTELMLQVVADMERGEVEGQKQEEAAASYAPLLTREIERVDWQKSAADVHNLIRGLNSWPGCHTLFRGKRLKLWKSQLIELEASGAQQGQILQLDEQGICVACGSGSLLLLEVQPEGKPRMSAAAFARGNRVCVGDCFGD